MFAPVQVLYDLDGGSHWRCELIPRGNLGWPNVKKILVKICDDASQMTDPLLQYSLKYSTVNNKGFYKKKKKPYYKFTLSLNKIYNKNNNNNNMQTQNTIISRISRISRIECRISRLGRTDARTILFREDIRNHYYFFII